MRARRRRSLSGRGLAPDFEVFRESLTMTKMPRQPNRAKQAHRPIVLCRQGDFFWLSSQQINNLATLQRQLGYGPPIVVTCSFAIEMYLKCLATLYHGKPHLVTHDLVQLFADIDPQTQLSVERAFNSHFLPQRASIVARMKGAPMPVPADFRDALSKGAKAFEEWRYMEGGTVYFGLNQLPRLLREQISLLRIDWTTVPIPLEGAVDGVDIPVAMPVVT